MNAKQILLLIASYLACTLVTYCFLKSINEKGYFSYAKVTYDKLDKILTKIGEDKTIYQYQSNGDINYLAYQRVNSNHTFTPTSHLRPSFYMHVKNKKTPKDTYYFGKYKTPERLLKRANSLCLDSEMNTSYFETCLNMYKGLIDSGDSARVVEGLSKFMTLEPAVEVDSSCTPPALPKVKCEDYKSVFGNGAKKAQREHKVGILIQLGFDADMLEVYLYEVYDVIDKFFIIESVVSHSDMQMKKPLIWESLKDTPRFKRFADKVVHFVVDDAERNTPNGNIWESEVTQEKLRWDKFVEWNEKHKFFGNDDVIGFGDTDEIPSRNAISVFKQCSGSMTHVDVGTTFFYGGAESVFMSDYPVRGYPYTVGDPSFFTLEDALKNKCNTPYPNRQRGYSEAYILGGAHISPYPYVPFIINKELVATEHTESILMTGNIEKLEDKYINDILTRHKSRTRKPADIMDQIKEHYYIPWIMRCVPDRYPSFFGKRDHRLYYPPCFFDFEC